MENQLMVFKNQEFGQVRMTEINNKPYAVANDVLKALGYAKGSWRTTLSRKCKGVTKCNGLKVNGVELNLIPEGDIYRLITSSKLSSAEKFESWVFDEVLPDIRKHGMYAKDELLDNPDLLIEVATELKKEKEARRIAEGKIGVFLETNNYLEWNTVAKNLEIGRNTMLKILREKQILQTDEYCLKGQKCTGEKHNIPYQKYMKYFKVKHVIKNGKRFPKVVVSADGQEFLRKVLKYN